MLFDKLQLLTSLDAADGATTGAHQKLSRALQGVVHCGHRAPEKVPIDAALSRIGARVEIGLGPMGMYQSELILKTKSGKSFRDVLDSTFVRGKKRAYTAMLSPVAGQGHPEAHHAPHGHEHPPDHGPHHHG
jgi:hypothetical protein